MVQGWVKEVEDVEQFVDSGERLVKVVEGAKVLGQRNAVRVVEVIGV